MTIPVALKPEKAAKTKVLLSAFALTDIGNSERLVELHGKDLRYCFPFKRWLTFDGTRWVKNDSGELRRRCKDTIRKLQKEAVAIDHDDTRGKVIKFALNQESDQKIRAMINMAQSEPGIPVMPEELDLDKYLFNCLNGTINLKTGKLLPHKRDHLITKIAPVNYDPEAECPRFMAHLDKVMGGKEDLIYFLQKAFGLCLTGDTERVIFIFYGSGANGKSITVMTIANVLGDYATRTPTETLLIKRNEGIPNDIAALRGMRLVYAAEAEQGKRLAEAKIKDITGGEKITARFLHGEFFEFTPEFKIFFGTNHKPNIKGTDQAIWDRIRLVPFTVRIPEDERRGKEEMMELFEPELSGILNWMVKGCLAWQKEGLGMPPDVQAATSDYRKEMDVLGEFIEDCCNLTPQATITKKDLYDHYESWANNNGEKPISKRLLGTMITERGIDEYRTGKVRAWMGIQIK